MSLFEKCAKVIGDCTSVDQLVSANVYLELARLRRFDPLTPIEHREICILYFETKQRLQAAELNTMEVAA